MTALVFWSLFYFIVIRTLFSEVAVGRLDIAQFLLDGKPYTHLYFLWLIIGLYAVAPVLASFLSGGDDRRARWFAGIVLGATILTGMSASVLTALGAPRPLTVLALTQWVPYVGYFLTGWALRGVRLCGWRLAAAVIATVGAVVATIVQYGLRTGVPLLDVIVPVSYYGPLVALAAVGVFVCANSLGAGWTPGSRAQRVLRELSDCAFGVFLVHFAIMVVLRSVEPFSRAGSSFVLSAVEWVLVVGLSFAVVVLMRRMPGLRRMV